MTGRRSCPLLWLAICWSVVAVVALIVIGIVYFREMEREFHRVAPEEEAAVAWIAEKGGRIGKEGERRHVVSVDLGGTNLCDSELERLRDLHHLRHLELSRTAITDAGLRVLAPLKSLTYIDVSYTRVTQEGLDLLPSQHPKLKMVAYDGIEE